ncbi:MULTISPECIES: hypothetical protein [Moorena]|uniref:Uncharacterized protein n=1 Tax=Moorena producens 3L TaxID=489825 RepID=F4XXC1_9CYAN|nr:MULTISPECIES: hypothetical protein [Moorena]NEQ10969.1 hypothetical protein [Moorena sp. SIO4E2]NER88255.1 hypothetical protein [Moorena sp. SIO3A2]EGJ30780.1 hypothetical protein LYNGBM3L_47100 [Moorena producens 3L]NEP36359.1 hypothetical protein [Moorena sp. SIO3B2]NEP65411.1 hypothetical protein [Moorena sp. SIO3A5]
MVALQRNHHNAHKWMKYSFVPSRISQVLKLMGQKLAESVHNRLQAAVARIGDWLQLS